MSATDAMLAKLSSPSSRSARSSATGWSRAPEKAAGRDLNEGEAELHKRTRDRMAEIVKQMEPLQDGARIASRVEDPQRAELVSMYTEARRPAAEDRVPLGWRVHRPTCTGPPRATPRPPSGWGCSTGSPPTRPRSTNPWSAAGSDRATGRQSSSRSHDRSAAPSARRTSVPAPGRMRG